ncbi:MAG: alpha/beta fold hydrolase [Ornithinimicrobium sp.]|uniref:alpha/beta fold hydrolase n=1 Tax=Ornithinimicrobium sp. TaxID=1977084 RepID=UPI003D9B6FAC
MSAAAEAPTGTYVELLGARVHWVELGGPAAAPEAICLFVHGLGGSGVNFEALAPLLTSRFRCLAPDLVGFGRTQAGTRRASVRDNTELLAAFIEQMVPAAMPLLLVGNSMGGLIAARYAEAHPDRLAGLVLLDPAVPPQRPVPGPGTLAAVGLYSVPALGTIIARARRRWRAPEASVWDTLRLCTTAPEQISPEVVARHVELAHDRIARPEQDPLYSEALRSTFGVLARRREADATYDDITAPVLLVHGTHDRLVAFSSALRMARRHPGWRFRPLSGRGHLAMLEAPGWLAQEIIEWWHTSRG